MEAEEEKFVAQEPSVSSTLAASDTVSQLPPDRLKWPLPILLRISLGVSSGPLANGVKLVEETENGVSMKGSQRETSVRDKVLVFTRPTWCTAAPPDSRCRTLRRNPDASTPITRHKIHVSRLIRASLTQCLCSFFRP